MDEYSEYRCTLLAGKAEARILALGPSQAVEGFAHHYLKGRGVDSVRVFSVATGESFVFHVEHGENRWASVRWIRGAT